MDTTIQAQRLKLPDTAERALRVQLEGALLKAPVPA
jgi:hypothetical protein